MVAQKREPQPKDVIVRKFQKIAAASLRAHSNRLDAAMKHRRSKGPTDGRGRNSGTLGGSGKKTFCCSAFIAGPAAHDAAGCALSVLPVACVIAAQLLLINYAKAISQFPTRRGKPSAIAFTWPPAENSD